LTNLAGTMCIAKSGNFESYTISSVECMTLSSLLSSIDNPVPNKDTHAHDLIQIPDYLQRSYQSNVQSPQVLPAWPLSSNISPMTNNDKHAQYMTWECRRIVGYEDFNLSMSVQKRLGLYHV